MDILDTPAAMREWSRTRHSTSARLATKNELSIGFVPTMGALHAGHLSLIAESRRCNDLTVVSIFVNPTQFNSADDFATYPRTMEIDLEACRRAGVDAVFAPTTESMYPAGSTTSIDPGEIASSMEGAHRPGHFAGVATVVVKLFHAVEPTRAYFGAKDYQQVAVIKRVVSDLDLPVEIHSLPTIREADGLAMSSRNVRLDPDERTAARVLFRGLQLARDAFDSGTRDASHLTRIIEDEITHESVCRIDYVAIVDPTSLMPLPVVDTTAVICLAVWCGDVRLIDNIALG